MRDENLLKSITDIVPTRMYTAAELAPLLRVGERTVRKYCTEGVFENAVKIAGGRRWLIPGADVWKVMGWKGENSELWELTEAS